MTFRKSQAPQYAQIGRSVSYGDDRPHVGHISLFSSTMSPPYSIIPSNARELFEEFLGDEVLVGAGPAQGG
jgi:hypothetical protein